MTKPKPKPASVVDSIRGVLSREEGKRATGLKPIEIVKVAISAYQAYYAGLLTAEAVESPDRASFRRGVQASVDRVLFNVNYWRSAWETRIVDACASADDAQACLRAISAWNTHTMKLNAMAPEEVIATFERFCPPFDNNNRRGSGGRQGAGSGPLGDFRRTIAEISQRDSRTAQRLISIADDVRAEANAYARYKNVPALDAFYDLLPAWCLQDRIELVRGTWWNDSAVMALIAEELFAKFTEMGYAESLCSYFLDAMQESSDGYALEIADVENPFACEPIPALIQTVRTARSTHPDSETDGYGTELPAWLASKEQLIWNTVVCAIYGPMYARPLLADDLDALPTDGKPVGDDVITDLAKRAYVGYLASRAESGVAAEFESFAAQPDDLKNSGIERVGDIPDKLKVLGYRIVPAASCRPDQRIDELRPSEVECLAILEHRRWLNERIAAGWTLSPNKDVSVRQSPYLLDWDDLPDRAREWNRRSAREIPQLLAAAGLAISRVS